MMYVHRWFALGGDSRATGRAITGFANLMFLFLLISGIYLWLPKVWNRTILHTKVFFNPKAKAGKARDFNWHHVFAFWSVIPLFFIITTASVFLLPVGQQDGLRRVWRAGAEQRAWIGRT